ncbi:MAG: SDR family oxidoreductase [Marinilabiliales bacterium]
MNINITDRTYLVCGATSGFGKAITMQLINENANVIAVARNKDKLKSLKKDNNKIIDIIDLDLTDSNSVSILLSKIENKKIDGAVINAGGPPAKPFKETTLDDWDKAYYQILRWKVDLSVKLAERMLVNKFGRLLFIESISVKFPIENLMLSTSLRMAVVGFVKFLSNEYSKYNITANVLAPGFHLTQAIERVIQSKADKENINYDEALKSFITDIPTGKIGKPENFASLATWLLSPLSDYITGQTISIDGGYNKYIFG